MAYSYSLYMHFTLRTCYSMIGGSSSGNSTPALTLFKQLPLQVYIRQLPSPQVYQ